MDTKTAVRAGRAEGRRGQARQGEGAPARDELAARASGLRGSAGSLDGSQLAFTSDGDIYVGPVHGQDERRVTSHDSFEGWPAWSPDGASLAVIRLEDGKPATIDVATRRILHSLEGARPSLVAGLTPSGRSHLR